MMQYFVANFSNLETQLSIIDDNNKTIDQQTVQIATENYVKDLAHYLIELSHQNNLYHDDIKGIGLCITDVELIHYDNKARLIEDLENTFGFKAIINAHHETLINQLTKLN
ncbi:hypothetical protein [Staphylococcus succinus]|uniref:hypothetical protein n=1 Tax=Staphylococcus succinus TaxID=61015 RepID=UPI001E30F032|nr:hypothetical protein [Staphylococcus succinus]MEB7462798.1 hypothetical protein [Staphylococcus succinus]